MTGDEALGDAFRHCAALVAEADKDRYLASLFVHEEARPGVHALQAFNVELARVRDVVSEPMPGEVRLQWWRDVIMATARGDVTGHPVALALLDTMSRYTLPQKTLLDMIDARTFDLYDDPMPTLNDLEGYCGETASALFQLSAIVAAGGDEPGTAELSGYAGVAYALTGLLRSVGFHARRNQVYLPMDVLARHGVSPEALRAGRSEPGVGEALADLRDKVRDYMDRIHELWPNVRPDARAVFLPVALVPPYLNRLDKVGEGAIAAPVDLPPWRKQWAIWSTARRYR